MMFAFSATAQNAEPELLPLVPLVPEAKPAAVPPKKKVPKKTETKTPAATATPAAPAAVKPTPAPAATAVPAQTAPDAAKPAPVVAPAPAAAPAPVPAATAVPGQTAPAPVPSVVKPAPVPAPAAAVVPAPTPPPAAPAPVPAPAPAAAGLKGEPKPVPEQVPAPLPPPAEKQNDIVTGTKAAPSQDASKSEKKVEAKKEKYKYVELAPVIGVMVPFQSSLAGAFFTVGARALYMLPVKGQPLAIGIDASYYSASFNVLIRNKGRSLDYSYWVVPLQLEIVYTIPTGTIWRPFVGVGGGTYIVGGKVTETAFNTAITQTTTTFGATGFLGLKAFVGIGDILLELRGNYAQTSLTSIVNNLNVGGFTATVGYMFYL